MIKNIEELKIEFPEDQFMLIEREEPLFALFGNYTDGIYEIWIGSPLKKGQKQPVLYRELNKEKVEKKDKYELGFNILMNYFDSISDEEKPKVDKQLKELGL